MTSDTVDVDCASASCFPQTFVVVGNRGESMSSLCKCFGVGAVFALEIISV